MLKITLPAAEMWDESKEEFLYMKERTLQLEHSLLSLSRWESKWNKAFLSKKEKTIDEAIDYVRCMTITQNVPDDAYLRITPTMLRQIDEYINAPMTATVIHDTPHTRGNNGSVLTSEVIYYQMIALNIPFECEKWHLNRLLTLIRVCNIKNTPPKKMSTQAIMRQNAALNEARRKRFNTKG